MYKVGKMLMIRAGMRLAATIPAFSGKVGSNERRLMREDHDPSFTPYVITNTSSVATFYNVLLHVLPRAKHVLEEVFIDDTDLSFVGTMRLVTNRDITLRLQFTAATEAGTTFRKLFKLRIGKAPIDLFIDYGNDKTRSYSGSMRDVFTSVRTDFARMRAASLRSSKPVKPVLIRS